MPSDPERDQAPPIEPGKQLLALATELLLEAAALGEPCAAERLVADGVLPAVYRDRYDQGFLEAFGEAIDQAHGLLVGASPYLPDTLSELAAHAIFRHARRVIQARGSGCHDLAIAIDAGLPDQLERNHQRLGTELELLYDAVFEDSDVLALFELEDAEAIAELRLRREERELLSFENWRVPFGSLRQPHNARPDGIVESAIPTKEEERRGGDLTTRDGVGGRDAERHDADASGRLM